VGDFEAGALASVESLVKYHPFYIGVLTFGLESGQGTVVGGQFDWGGLLPKSNGGVQRFPQCGWQSHVEHKGIRELNCETYQSSRWETRA
jgi:hypothetical protein